MVELIIESATAIIKRLEKLGFRLHRQKGSHAQYVAKRDGRHYLVTVPVHRGDLHTPVIASIIRQSGLSRDEFYTNTR